MEINFFPYLCAMTTKNIATSPESRKLIFFLEGRIDTVTAASADHEIEAAIAAQTGITQLEFDCSKLEYISSTGLRIILKYKKMFPELEVTNTSNEVYNVFELTGFSRIMTVRKALRKVDLSTCHLLAQGANGAVYRINNEEIIKVLHRADTESALREELQRSKAAFVLGVPTAISYDIVDCGDGRQGAVYEALNSDTLGHYLHTHQEEMQKCAVSYANLLRIIHSTEGDAAEFGSIKDTYSRLFDAAAEYLTAEELKVCRELLDMIPDRNTLIHADAHTNNILLGADGELMFIDMADTAVGHPLFDYIGIALAMIYTQRDERCLGICGLSSSEVNPFIATTLAYRFGLNGQDEIRTFIQHITSVAMLKYAAVIGKSTATITQMRPQLLNVLRQRFFPRINEVKTDLQWLIEKM